MWKRAKGPNLTGIKILNKFKEYKKCLKYLKINYAKNKNIYMRGKEHTTLKDK